MLHYRLQNYTNTSFKNKKGFAIKITIVITISNEIYKKWDLLCVKITKLATGNEIELCKNFNIIIKGGRN
jgi:hypothetical protein